MSDQRDLVETEHQEISEYQGNGNITSLIRLAVDRNADIDKLERLIALRDREEARVAALEFEQHFAAMQSEFKAAVRSKKGYDYRYAPIEVLQQNYGPVIARHGFSYRWKEEAIEGGKRSIMTISGWGHHEETAFDIPQIEGTKQMNPVQVAGAMSTYGRRYTFIAGFGLIIADEDDDAQSLSFSDGVKYADYVHAMEAETDLDALRETAKAQYQALKKEGDHAGAEKMVKIYNQRKAELEAV